MLRIPQMAVVLLFAGFASAPSLAEPGESKPSVPIKISDARPDWERQHCVGKNKVLDVAKLAVFFALEEFQPAALTSLQREIHQSVAKSGRPTRRVKLELLSFQVVYKESPGVQRVHWTGAKNLPPHDLLTSFGPHLTCVLRTRVTCIWPDKTRDTYEVRGTMHSGPLDERGYGKEDLLMVVNGALADFGANLLKAMRDPSARQAASGP